MTYGLVIPAVVAICYNSSRISQRNDGTIRPFREFSVQGLPIMRRLQGQPRTEGDDRLRVRAAEDDSELALLAQFMRHDTVASLANAIAERTGVRRGDLIAAAGLDPHHADS
jgi:hypothetical protein